MNRKSEIHARRNVWFILGVAFLSLAAFMLILPPIFSLAQDALDTLFRSWGALPGIGNNLLHSLWLVLTVMAVVTPSSFGMALWMFSFAQQRSALRVRRWLSAFAMMPAVLLGLLGRVILAPYLGNGALAMVILMCVFVLPYLTLSFEEVLRMTPRALPEAGMLLGISKMTAVWRLVLPGSAKDLLRCCITCVERILGEATALLALLGAVPEDSVLSVELFRLTWIGRQDAALLAFCLGLCLALLRLTTLQRWGYDEREARRYGNRDIWQRD